MKTIPEIVDAVNEFVTDKSFWFVFGILFLIALLIG